MEKVKRLLRMAELTQKVGLCSSQIYKLIQDDRFPEQVKVYGRVSVWVEAEIDAWIDERVRESRTEAA